jgi:hypothetical protein
MADMGEYRTFRAARAPRPEKRGRERRAADVAAAAELLNPEIS